LDKRIIDQAEGLRRLLAGRASRIVAVTGGPAGVGCTSTVVNLAAALASLGKDVLVVDERADVHSASATLAGAWLRDGERTRVAAGFGLCGAARLARAGYSDAQLSDFIDGPADIVLVDAQLGADGSFSALAREAHDVLVVTRVAAQAITEAYACMKRLHFAHAFAQFRVLTNPGRQPRGREDGLRQPRGRREPLPDRIDRRCGLRERRSARRARPRTDACGGRRVPVVACRARLPADCRRFVVLADAPAFGCGPRGPRRRQAVV